VFCYFHNNLFILIAISVFSQQLRYFHSYSIIVTIIQLFSHQSIIVTTIALFLQLFVCTTTIPILEQPSPHFRKHLVYHNWFGFTSEVYSVRNGFGPVISVEVVFAGPKAFLGDGRLWLYMCGRRLFVLSSICHSVFLCCSDLLWELPVVSFHESNCLHPKIVESGPNESISDSIC